MVISRLLCSNLRDFECHLVLELFGEMEEELQAVTWHLMDSPKKLNPTWALKSSQMLCEYSADTQAVSEVLAKNLGNLILSPSTEFPSLLPECSPQ